MATPEYNGIGGYVFLVSAYGSRSNVPSDYGSTTMSIEGNASVPMQGRPMNHPESTPRHRSVMPRMRLLAALLAANGLLLAGSAAAAGTDDPPGTVIPSFPFSDTGSTVGFNNTYQTYGGPCGADLPFPYPGGDAFYRVQMNAGATYSFSMDLTGSGGDLALFLLSDSADAASCVGNSQDAIGPGAGPELLEFTATATQEYFLVIDSYYAAGSGGSEGIYSLSVDCIAGDCGAAESADLSITKDDGVEEAAAGSTVTYTITAQNAGPDDVASATITDLFPAGCVTVEWTCAGAGGGTCAPSGSGDIEDTAALPTGASVTYTAECAIDPAATGTLENTATVESATADPDTANNSATDTDTVTADPNDIIFTDGFEPAET